MKIFSDTFSFSFKREKWIGEETDISLCKVQFNKLFDISDDVKEIEISIHNLPTPNRLRCLVEECKDHTGKAYPNIMIDDDLLEWPLVEETNAEVMDEALMKYIGRHVYVEVTY